jgi:hypothetical protein
MMMMMTHVGESVQIRCLPSLQASAFVLFPAQPNGAGV